MAEVKLNFKQYDEVIAKACMDRIRVAANVIKEAAKSRCVVGTVNRPLKPGQKFWMEREVGAMRKTIRTVEKTGEKGLVSREVRVYAGNKKTWWATQMEFGRGGWKGGRRSFMRPAIKATNVEVKHILENG
jgi:HK97 gp10 family phage protein